MPCIFAMTLLDPVISQSLRESVVRVESHRRADFHRTMSYALNILAQGVTELVRRDLVLRFQFS